MIELFNIPSWGGGHQSCPTSVLTWLYLILFLLLVACVGG